MIRSRHDRVALVMVAAHLVFRAMLLSDGFYVADDFRYLTGATTRSFGAFVLQDYQGHLMPGQFAIIWLHQRAFPMAYWPAVVVTLVLQALAAVLMWRLLREFVTANRSTLVAFGVYLLAPLSISAFVWYAAALQTLPLQMAVAGALFHHLRFARRGRRADLWWALAWYAFGLVMWEKAVVVLLLGALVTGLWSPYGSGPRAAARAWWRDRRMWAGYAGLTVAYVVGYLVLTDPADRGFGAPWTAYFRVARDALAHGLMPYLLGGPLGKGERALIGPQVTHGPWYAACALAVVVVTVLRQRPAWRAWLLLAVYIGANVVATTAVRFVVWRYAVGFLSRYYADVVLVGALALAAALTVPEERREDARSLTGTSWQRWGWRWAAGAAATLFAVMSVVSARSIADGFPAGVTRTFVQNAASDLAGHPNPVLLDAPADAATLGPDAVSTFLTPLPQRPRFDVPTEQLLQALPDGHIVEFPFRGGATTPPGPDGACGHAVEGDTATEIRFASPISPWRWVIELRYFTGADATIEFTVNGTTQSAPVHEGAHAVYFVVSGGLDVVGVRAVDASMPVCVVKLRVARGT